MDEQVPNGVTVVKTIEVSGPAGLAIINESDLPEYEARGYVVSKPAVVETEVETEGE